MHINLEGRPKLIFRSFNLDARPSQTPKKGLPTHEGGTSGANTDAGPSAPTFPSTKLPFDAEEGPIMGWSNFFQNQQYISNLIGALKTSVDERFDNYERRMDKADANMDDLRIEFLNYKKRNDVEHRKTRALIRTRFDLPAENDMGDGNTIYEDEANPAGSNIPIPEDPIPEMAMDVDGLGEDANFNYGRDNEENNANLDVNNDDDEELGEYEDADYNEDDDEGLGEYGDDDYNEDDDYYDGGDDDDGGDFAEPSGGYKTGTFPGVF